MYFRCALRNRVVGVVVVKAEGIERLLSKLIWIPLSLNRSPNSLDLMQIKSHLFFWRASTTQNISNILEYELLIVVQTRLNESRNNCDKTTLDNGRFV
jgi:hypothetical protein